jgi:serine/threonine protein kinase
MDLLALMLSSSPERRPNAEQCLAHPWFKNDRQVLNDMLVVNKRSVSPYKEEYVYEEGKSEFKSFIVAPNYFKKPEA